MSRARRLLFRRLLGLLGIIAVACALGLDASPAAAKQFGAIEVVVEPLPAVEGATPDVRAGYLEYRLTVRNRSKTVDHTVRLIQPAIRHTFNSYTDYLERNSRTVQVAHGSTLVVSLFQPALVVPDQSLAVEIDGSRQKDFVELPGSFGRGLGYYSRSGSGSSMLVLASRGIPQELKDEVRLAQHNTIAFCRSELATSDWSANWLGYTAYDVVLLTEQEAASLPADVLLALRRFVEAGGILLVHPSSADSEHIVPDALRDPDAAADEDGAFHVGFGLVRPRPELTPWPVESWCAKSRDEVAPMDRAVQIVGEVSVPIRGLLVVVICFAIGVGPVNVWLLSRRQKRMWLWWNVPAVSLVTCLTVFGYSLLAEGVRGHGRTALITLLDENTHRATTLGYASYYCPLTPGDGLRFSYDTAVTQLETNFAGHLRYSDGRPKTIDWTNDQHLDSGWIVARVPACFGIRKSETRRERLTVHRGAGGAITVVNGLGVDIDSLYYVDDDGVAGIASDVPAGAEHALEMRPAAGKTPVVKVLPSDEPASLRSVFEQPWNSGLRQLRDFPQNYVKPGCYLAVVKKSPFLEDPLVAAPQEGGSGVIYGIGARTGNGR